MKEHTFVILAYQESDDLEECIKSILKQSVKSNVLIATSTPNDYILDMASKYSLGIKINENESNKGDDYNFAINSYNSKLLTIAHQDDLYDRNYTKEVLKCFKKNPDATIIFTDNYEIKDNKKIKKSRELDRKKFHLLPLKYSLFQKSKYFKLRALKKEKYICTSSITFIKENINYDIFPTNLVYHNDWEGLVTLARDKTKFVYLKKRLVGYRIDNKKNSEERKKEEIEIRRKLYSKFIFNHFIIKKYLK